MGPEPPGPVNRYHPRNVLSLDTPDGTGTAPMSLPSADLLARAQVGWENFLLGMGPEEPHE